MHTPNPFSSTVKLPVPMAALLAVTVTMLLIGNNEALAKDCKSVSTHVSSQQVAQFSDGTACPAAQICTEGRFTGGLNGNFRFHGTGSPYPAFLVDPQLPNFDPITGNPPPSFSAPWMFFTTGEIRLDTKFCGNSNQTGILVLRDATTFAVTAFPPFNPEIAGPFGDAAWVDGGASTGTCAGASGLLTGIGIFKAGCVDCDYEGKVCRP